MQFWKPPENVSLEISKINSGKCHTFQKKSSGRNKLRTRYQSEHHMGFSKIGTISDLRRFFPLSTVVIAVMFCFLYEVKKKSKKVVDYWRFGRKKFTLKNVKHVLSLFKFNCAVDGLV